jgi:hypothetical protein
MSTQSLMVLIAGPYHSGTGDDPERMASNLRACDKSRYELRVNPRRE